MKKTRICIIDQGEIFGGAEHYTLDLLRHIPKEEFDVHVLISKNVAAQYKESLAEIEGITVQGVSLHKLRPIRLKSVLLYIKVCFEIFWYLLKHKVELVATNTVRAHVVGAAACWLLRKPVVWTIHDFTFPRIWLRRFAFIPNEIICVSDVIARYVLETLENPQDVRVKVVPNGVDTDAMDRREMPAVIKDIRGRAFSFEDGVRYVGLIGRIDTWKGQDIFIQAAEILMTQYPQHKDVVYLIVGDVTATSKERKEYFDQLQAYVKEHRLHDIRFLGHQDSAGILRHLDILVHASTEPEPFGRTIIEAFYMEVPVIASNIGAPNDIITYGESGLLFTHGNPQDLAQKISLVLEDKHLQNTMKMHAKREINLKYSINRVVDEIIKLWRGAIKR